MNTEEKESKRNILVQIFAWTPPLSSTFLALTGMGFYLAFLPLFLTAQSYTRLEIGLVQAAYFLGLFTGAWKIEPIVRRVGHSQALAASGSLMTAAILFQSFSSSLPLWFVTRYLTGIGIAAFYVVIECWMLDKVDQKLKGLALSLYMLALNGGYALGPQIMKGVSLEGTFGFEITAVLVTLSIIPIALSSRRLPVPEVEGGLSTRKLIRTSPFGTAACFAAGIINGAIYSYLVLTGDEFSVPGATLLSIYMLGGFMGQWPFGKLSDIFDRRQVLLALCILALGFAVTLTLTSHLSTNMIMASTFVLGAACFAIYPVSLAQVTDHVGEDSLTAAMATMLLVYGVGSILGPLGAALAMNLWGDPGLFTFVAFICLGMGAVGFYGMLYRPPVPEKDQGLFQALPHTTQLAFEMDPRVDLEEETN